MKATKRTVAALMAAPVFLLFALQSCSTYNLKTADIENQLVTGQFTEASKSIDANKFLNKKRNRLLYLLEKGKMEHLAGNYTESNRLFEQAYILIDDQIKTNAGQTVAAKFTNPMAEPYKGEDFEKVTIHYYMALNYFFLGQPNEALVEAKRINIKLLQLNEKYKENKNKYTRDAFSQILQGILYEGTGDINNAFIAYRNAEEIYSGSNGSYFGVAMPEQLKKDLLRTARQLGFTEEYNAYLKKYNIKAPNSTPVAPTGEAIIFWENGLAPAKDQIVATVSGAGHFFYATYMDEGEVFDILLPIPLGTNVGTINAIAIPKYRTRPSFYNKAALIVNGQEQFFETSQDFNSIARRCLKDRMLRETVDLVVRFAAKKGGSALLAAIAKETLGDTGEDLVRLGADAAGALTEKADTRNWQSLPSTIGYTRVPLQQGIENKFVIKKYGPNGIVDNDTISIPYGRGLQIINYFDLGRTQVIPNQNTTSKPVASKAEPISKTIAEKYDKWIDGGNGLSYKVSYYNTNKDDIQQYGKKIVFRSDRPTTITYVITEKPYSKDLKVVTLDEYEKLEDEGKTDNATYMLTDKITPGKEITGWYPYIHKNPDFYVTILKVEP
ncbi:hypothetical protein GR160_03085 [Flavobacterium sp. Sd200]|uniref:COG3014 family protein n=1 Tax=Flavobacterium sp. Sd200 TaxID=2692211 RepID=UPI00136D2CFF|nr:hypothetical protein [Flavobacterium sp. Sd200]MXN90199.1 hypothetical protein [Flavobacterium sp. Sd200]